MIYNIVEILFKKITETSISRFKHRMELVVYFYFPLLRRWIKKWTMTIIINNSSTKPACALTIILWMALLCIDMRNSGYTSSSQYYHGTTTTTRRYYNGLKYHNIMYLHFKP